MGIIYTLTIVFIFILHIFIYKKEEKLNLLKWLIINIILCFTYNIFICVVLSFIKIPITLTTLSILNLIIIILFSIKLFKDKKIQKYYINKFDIIISVIMIILTIFITVKFYGPQLNLTNSITDGAAHYFIADEFYRSDKLLEKDAEAFNFWNLSTFMPGAYINTGIIFKIFAGIIEEIYFCKIYLLFNIFIWLLSGLLMYFLLENNSKKLKDKILPFLFSLVYMLAYPLNSVISGFSYLSLALDIIITILIIVKLEMNVYYKSILLFFLNFGLYFSYYYFVPVVYLAIFLEILITMKRKKQKILGKESIISILFSLFIPGLFGLTFFQIIPLITSNKNPVTSIIGNLGIEGGIYTNLFTNILIFLVLSIWNFIYKIKNKKIDIMDLTLILSLIFGITIFIGMKCQIVSEYYYYKIYYLLWIFLITSAYGGLITIMQKGKLFKIAGYIFFIIYCIGLCISITINKNLIFFDIFIYNNEYIQQAKPLIYHEELEIIDYYNKNMNTDKKENPKTYFCISPADRGRTLWIYALTKNPYDFVNATYGEYAFNLEEFMKTDNQYAVIFKMDYLGNFEEIDKEIEKNNLKILFRNEMGIILEKN